MLYKIEGKVIAGNKRGKSLGYPTANIALNQNIPEGIYVSQTDYDGSFHPSITFIGKAETFNENIYQSETYVLDVNLNFYNQTLQVELLQKIRDNQKFKSTVDLLEAMKNDEKEARNYFEKLKGK